MSHETLSLIWAGLLAVLLIGYAILDGFDLGVGILHRLVPLNDRDKRVFMNSIGPLWDGNEVWLVTFGGALFAAFPEAYATAFSGFYTAFMLLLFALILRAVSMEFRGKVQGKGWRGLWDWAFFLGSFLASLLFGVAVGNAIIGIPLDARGDSTGSFLAQLNPYAMSVGILTVALFAMHGAIFLYLKTSGELQARLHTWIWRTYFLFLAAYLTVSIYTLIVVPEATKNFAQLPLAWIVPVLNLLAVANIPRAIYLRRPGYAFVSSSATIAALVFLFAVALLPNLVVSNPNPEHGLTIFNAASSQRTLGIMLAIAAFGMPFVLTYTFVIYRTYWGKVQLDEHSY
jgi:cytochrome d ubiquinol oxidase subunit II